MCKIYVLFGVLTFWSIQSVIAQNNSVIDSLEKLLYSNTTSSEKAKLYNRLAGEYIHNDIEKALDYATKGLRLVSSNEPMVSAHLHNTTGLVLGEFEVLEKTRKSILHLDTALTLYTRLNDSTEILKMYANMGGVYRSLFEYDLALSSFQNGIIVAKQLKDTFGLARNLSGVAGIYFVQKNIEEALKLIKEAYHLTCKLKNTENAQKNESIVSYAGNIGHIYSVSEVFDSSLHYFNIALSFLDEKSKSSKIGIFYEAISNVYQKQNKIDSAILYINKAVDLAEKLNNENLKLKVKSTLAKIYYKSNNFEESIRCAEENLALAKKTANYIVQSKCLGVLIANYERLKNFEKAYSAYSQLVEVEKTMLDKDKRKHINELEVQYETYKKEQENKLLIKDRDVQKLKAERNEQTVYAVCLILLIVVLITYGFYQRAQLQGRERTNQLKQQLLRNQMNPHFIFNALIAIQSFVYKNEPKETDKYLSAFSKLMRGILENSTQEYITLEKELKWLRNYLKLQWLRFDHKFTYEIIIDPVLEIDDLLIPPMLTQPFIENALEHGLKNIDYGGKIYVYFEKEEKYLKVRIEDNGIGINVENSTKQKTEHNSLATKITKERIAFLNKTTATKIYFEISSNKYKGALVTFKIPLKYT